MSAQPLDADWWRGADRALPLPDAPVLVYGAGATGRSVGAHLLSVGIAIEAFLDHDATQGQRCVGVPVHRPNAWRGDPAGHDVFIAVHNPSVDIGVLSARLRGFGFRRVLTMVDYQQMFPDDRTPRYWLAPAGVCIRHAEAIRRLRDALTDARSLEWLDGTLAYRLTGDAARLPMPSLADLYFPRDLPRWRDPLRFIDCGAYTGDTIAALVRRAGYRHAAIAAFEPDPDSFAILSRRAALFGPAQCYPQAVGASAGTLRFASGKGGASRADDDGNICVDRVALDEVLADFAPTLIKMDIEGAEADALAGASGLIAGSRPALAISLYHQPAHLWELPLQILDWQLDYDLFVRGHGHAGFDLVLYALPRLRPSGAA